MKTSLLLLFSCLPIVSPVRAQTQPSPSPSLTSQSSAARIEEALKTQDSAGAMREYRAMVAANPENAQAWTGMGVLLYGSGHASEADDALRHALRLDPTAPRAELFLALSQADEGACHEALPVLRHRFESEPVGKLHRLTGITLLECLAGGDDTRIALPVAERLKSAYPGDPDILYEATRLYTKMWDETANELLTAHPESYRVHQLAGEVNEAQGNFAQAIRQYQTALAGNPKLPQMHFHIGQLLLKQGDPDADARATEQFQAELAINPRSASSALAIAEIERHQGDLTQAAAEYTLALQLEPGLPEARTGLAQTLLAQHQLGAAQAEVHSLLTEHPDNAEAHYVLMLTLREQGKLTEAAAEMATFQRLRHGKAEQFQQKLNALLTGSPIKPLAAEVVPAK